MDIQPTIYDYALDPGAENNTAASIYRYAREGGTRILDLGSGPGIVASHLQRHDGRTVTCLDADETHLAAARERGVERTILADLSSPSWPDQLVDEQFDVIVLADVLEHLVDPERVLAAIRDRQLLADGGFLVVSIPNASHEVIVLGLLAGRFQYSDTGLLDRTHLRWFTRDSFQAMVEEQGFTVTRIARTIRTLAQTPYRDLAPDLPTELSDQLAKHASLETRTYQYVMRVDPLSAATRLRLMEEQAASDRAERDEEIRQLTAELVMVREQHAKELAARQGDRDRSVGAALDGEHARVERLERKLEEVYDSKTWKAGAAVLWLPKKLRGRSRPVEDK